MIDIVHLLDDFAMGGVTRALTLFDEPAITRLARSRVSPIQPGVRLAPKIDAEIIVDHIAISWSRLSFLASLRARNRKARILHVEHSYTRGFEGHEVTSRARFRIMIRIAARMFDKIICVSDAQRAWFENEVGIAPERLNVIHPWTDRIDLFNLPPNEKRGHRPLHLLAYGRYAKVKNFAELVVAMRSFRPSQVRLTLFGDGPQRDLLTALATDLPHVDVLGPLDDPSVLLELCDAVVVPSRYESFGLVATEARMAARALIAADVDGLPEQAREGGHIAPLGDAQEIAEAISWALDTNLAQMGVAGRRSVKGHHTRILHQWTQLIRETEGAVPDTFSPKRKFAVGGAVT